MAYNERKPELRPLINTEESLKSSLSTEQLMVLSEIRSLLATYKSTVTDVEAKSFGQGANTRNKIRDLEDKIIREGEIIPKEYKIWNVLQNVLDGVTLPENGDLKFDEKGYITKAIKETFKV